MNALQPLGVNTCCLVMDPMDQIHTKYMYTCSVLVLAVVLLSSLEQDAIPF